MQTVVEILDDLCEKFKNVTNLKNMRAAQNLLPHPTFFCSKNISGDWIEELQCAFDVPVLGKCRKMERK